MNRNVLIFLGKASGNLAASSFSSVIPIAMYSFSSECSDRMSTRAFSFVIPSDYGKVLRLGGRASGLSTLSSASRT